MAKRALESETKKAMSANDLVLKVKEIAQNLNFLPHQPGDPRKLGEIFFSDLRHEKDPDNTVLLSFTGGGRIPTSFGIGNDRTGTKTYLTVDLEDEAEIKAMEVLDEHLKKFLFKKEHWPPSTKPDDIPQTQREADKSYNPIMRPRAPKKDKDGNPSDEFWDPKLKMQIPIGESGEVTRKVRVIDTNKNVLSFHNLPGLRWKVIVMALTGWYFGNGKAGISCKLRHIKVENKPAEIPSDIFDELGDPLGLGNSTPDPVVEASSEPAPDEGTEENQKRKKKVKVK